MAQYFLDTSSEKVGNAYPSWASIAANSNPITSSIVSAIGPDGTTQPLWQLNPAGTSPASTGVTIPSVGTATDCDIAVLMAVQQDSNYYLAFGPSGRMVTSGGINGYQGIFKENLGIDIRVGSPPSQLAEDTTVSYASLAWFWMRLNISGSTISLRSWPYGSAEPSTWNLSLTDTTLTAAGAIGLMGWSQINTYVQSIGVGTGTDSAPTGPVSGGTTTTLALATETDTAQALNSSLLTSLSTVSETDIANTLSASLVSSLSSASETDSALSLHSGYVQSLTIASESDSAQPLSSAYVQALVASTETDNALGLITSYSVALTVASETDQAKPLNIPNVKTVTLSKAQETDSANPLNGSLVQTFTGASETDAAGSLHTAYQFTLATAGETDTAKPLTGVISLSLSTAVETDQSLPLKSSIVGRLGTGSEVDQSNALKSWLQVALSTANETDTAHSIGSPLLAVLATASEIDRALPIHGFTFIPIPDQIKIESSTKKYTISSITTTYTIIRQ